MGIQWNAICLLPTSQQIVVRKSVVPQRVGYILYTQPAPRQASTDDTFKVFCAIVFPNNVELVPRSLLLVPGERHVFAMHFIADKTDLAAGRQAQLGWQPNAAETVFHGPCPSPSERKH